jgi:hypothetical protein
MSKIKPLEEGIHESQQFKYHHHFPLKTLIENNVVEQDENGDWVMISYGRGMTNSKEYFHYLETGYLTNWYIIKWKHDADQDETNTCYRIEYKNHTSREFLTIVNKHHRYSRYLFEGDNFWTEEIVSLKTGDWDQIYYRDSLNKKSRKVPVKLGKNIQEIKDKGIVSGFYKF